MHFLNDIRICKTIRLFCFCDLNRLFGEDFPSLKKIPSPNYEQQRALELGKYLGKANYLLDIHSTIKPSVPFVYAKDTPRHRELANLFETDFIISPAPSFAPKELFSSTDTFVDNHGGIGLTYESGWHKDLSVVDAVARRAKLFLQVVGAISPNKQPPAKNHARHLSIYDHVIPETGQFSFSENVENFSFFETGKTLAFDLRKPIIVPHDSYVVFPKDDIKKGGVACYLARHL